MEMQAPEFVLHGPDAVRSQYFELCSPQGGTGEELTVLDATLCWPAKIC
jgi:hypothetical protein